MGVQPIKSRKEIMESVLEETFKDYKIAFIKEDNGCYTLSLVVYDYIFIASIIHTEGVGFRIICSAFGINRLFEVRDLHQFLKFVIHCTDKWVELNRNFGKGEIYGMMVKGYLETDNPDCTFNVILRNYTNGLFLEIKTSRTIDTIRFINQSIHLVPCDLDVHPIDTSASVQSILNGNQSK